jgi:aminopeptidase-like protein
MNKSSGNEMYQWASDLFPLNRSLTGEGVRETLNYIKNELPELEIFEVPSGTKVFDWTVPKEWKIREGWIADVNGNKLIDLATNNLHIMGYSISVDKIVSRSELEPYLYSLPEQPTAIPYITSYYKENFGFCLSQDQRDSLGDGPFHIFIDSQLFDGNLTYAELLIPGDTKEEILFSTYVCHPSMANNELSGPVVSMALAKHIQSLESRRFSYRFLFTVETIGSILYISKHLKRMKENLVCGWVLTCMGDERTYSYVPTRNGETLTDFVSKRVLKDLGCDFLEYSWLDRGSDERQFNSPGVDLPFASLMRTRYGDYPEYHTSLDNLEVISPEGLSGGLEMLKSAVKILETNAYWKVNVLCEPQLGKRGLYPNVSTKTSGLEIRNQMNVISYFDGSTDLLRIADKCKISYNEVLEVLEKLKNSGLIDKVGIRKRS